MLPALTCACNKILLNNLLAFTFKSGHPEDLRWSGSTRFKKNYESLSWLQTNWANIKYDVLCVSFLAVDELVFFSISMALLRRKNLVVKSSDSHDTTHSTLLCTVVVVRSLFSDIRTSQVHPNNTGS